MVKFFVNIVFPRRIAAAATGIAALMTAYLVLLHLRMIVSPAPQEMREGAIIWITRLLLEGRNPYAIAELPASTNAYGILYHLVVLPFARAFGNGYTVHRAVSAVAIAGSSVLMYRLLRREKADRLVAAVGVMLFYASSLYFVAPLARPDGFGVFLAMASITLLFSDDVSEVRFLIGLAFDGNYEALSHKISFDPVYNRTICVDVRYVLWCIDKLGGATNLINELKLVKQ